MTTVVDIHLAELKKRREELSEHLGTGAVKDYAEYRETCGVIRGLTLAESYLTDLLKRQEHLEDE